MNNEMYINTSLITSNRFFTFPDLHNSSHLPQHQQFMQQLLRSGTIKRSFNDTSMRNSQLSLL